MLWWKCCVFRFPQRADVFFRFSIVSVVGVSLFHCDIAVQAFYLSQPCAVSAPRTLEHGDRSSQSAQEEGGLVQRERITVGRNQVDCDGRNEELVNKDLKLI